MKPDDPKSIADEADRQLLMLANEQGKFAVSILGGATRELTEAIERGLDNNWFQLLDVAFLEHVPDIPMRIFRLTPLGWARRKELVIQ